MPTGSKGPQSERSGCQRDKPFETPHTNGEFASFYTGYFVQEAALSQRYFFHRPFLGEKVVYELPSDPTPIGNGEFLTFSKNKIYFNTLEKLAYKETTVKGPGEPFIIRVASNLEATRFVLVLIEMKSHDIFTCVYYTHKQKGVRFRELYINEEHNIFDFLTNTLVIASSSVFPSLPALTLLELEPEPPVGAEESKRKERYHIDGNIGTPLEEVPQSDPPSNPPHDPREEFLLPGALPLSTFPVEFAIVDSRTVVELERKSWLQVRTVTDDHKVDCKSYHIFDLGLSRIFSCEGCLWGVPKEESGNQVYRIDLDKIDEFLGNPEKTWIPEVPPEEAIFLYASKKDYDSLTKFLMNSSDLVKDTASVVSAFLLPRRSKGS